MKTLPSMMVSITLFVFLILTGCTVVPTYYSPPPVYQYQPYYYSPPPVYQYQPYYYSPPPVYYNRHRQDLRQFPPSEQEMHIEIHQYHH